MQQQQQDEYQMFVGSKFRYGLGVS